MMVLASKFKPGSFCLYITKSTRKVEELVLT